MNSELDLDDKVNDDDFENVITITENSVTTSKDIVIPLGVPNADEVVLFVDACARSTCKDKDRLVNVNYFNMCRILIL